MKKFVLFTIIFLFFFAGMAGIAEAEGDTRCAVWSFETQTIHINSLIIPLYNDEGERVGEVYFWADFRLVSTPSGEEGLFFELCPKYGYSEQADDNCSAWNPETQTVHISSLLIGENRFWVDLVWKGDLGLFQLKNDGWGSCSLKDFGVAITAFNGYGNPLENISQVAPFSTIIMAGSDVGTDDPIKIAKDDIKKIIFARKNGCKGILCIPQIFFEAELDEDGNIIGVKLRNDYQLRWRLYANFISPYVKDIYAIYGPLDEPYWVAIQFGIGIGEMKNMINQAIKEIKQRFPDMLVIGVVAVTKEDLEQESVFGFPVPPNAAEEYGMPNFDIVGFDLYWAQFSLYNYDQNLQTFFEVWTGKYMKNLIEFLLPGQKIVLAPGTYCTANNLIPAEDFLAIANFIYDFARLNPKLVEIVVPFLWTWQEGSSSLGLRDLPPEVQKKWEDIGKKIKNN